MDKIVNIEDIYIGLERRDEYSEFLEEYELWEEHVILKKMKYHLRIDDNIIEMYKNIENGEQLYIDNDGFVINSKDEITEERTYHQIYNLISIKDLLKKFKIDSRDDSQYREYIMPIYQKVFNTLNDKNTITISELNAVFGNLNDIHSYVFELIEEEEYEDLFGCRVYSFDTGKRIKR